MRPSERSFLAPARRPSERGNAFNGTDFIFLICSGSAQLTGASALKFKQRIYRRIIMDSLDSFAQKSRNRQRGDPDTVNRRAKDSISCYQFVNIRFFQSLDADLVQNRVRDTGQNLLRPLLLQQSRRVR